MSAIYLIPRVTRTALSPNTNLSALFLQVSRCASTSRKYKESLQETVYLGRSQKNRHLYDSSLNGNRTKDVKASYSVLQDIKKQQAECSILIQHPGNLAKTLNICQEHGNLKAVFPFKNENRTYALVEYANPECVESLLADTEHMPNERRITMKTRFLFLKSRKRVLGNGLSKFDAVIYKTQLFSHVNLWDDMEKAKSVSDQMEILHQKLALPELGRRLRFFLAQTIEDVLKGIFHQCEVLPFGSSVNGFGRYDCDVDMVFIQDKNINKVKRYSDSKFQFLTKMRLEDGRQSIQETLQTIGGIIKHFLPQYVHVTRILHARVPIIKFKQVGLSLECDLTMDNRMALHMSEMLYLFGQMDSRVHPLVFTVRNWAWVNDLTSNCSPGPQMSNFTLTLLIIHFLQNVKPPILPSLKELSSLAEQTNAEVIDSEVRLLSDLSLVPKSKNTTSSGHLLKDFFAYYKDYDFKSNAVSLITTTKVLKADLPMAKEFDAPMFIINPLEPLLCVSKNVSEKEIESFHELCNAALKSLEESNDRSNKNWGLLKLISEDSFTKKSERESNLDTSDEQRRIDVINFTTEV